MFCTNLNMYTNLSIEVIYFCITPNKCLGAQNVSFRVSKFKLSSNIFLKMNEFTYGF